MHKTTRKSECKECAKAYINLLSHIVKSHKKFVCVGCKEYKPVDTAIGELAGNKTKGKLSNNALCEDCWT